MSVMGSQCALKFTLGWAGNCEKEIYQVYT